MNVKFFSSNPDIDYGQLVHTIKTQPPPKSIPNQYLNCNKYTHTAILTSQDYLEIKSKYPTTHIGIVFSYWSSNRGQKMGELRYGDGLFPQPDWEREVCIPGVGRIDGLCRKDRRIVELKFLKGWKSALGQVLAYKKNKFTDYSAEIWLLTQKNELNPKLEKLITSTCSSLGVKVQFIYIG
jgi:hypothetical protein